MEKSNDFLKVREAARCCLVELFYIDQNLLIEIVDGLLKDSDDFLFKDHSDENIDFGFLHAIIDSRSFQCFKIVWNCAHQKLWDGLRPRYADLDNYANLKNLVDDLFFSSIKNNCDEIFYFLMGYALPNFDRCFDAFTNSGDSKNEVIDYLSRYFHLSKPIKACLD